MIIQINTDHNINGHEELIRHTEAMVKSTLEHLAEHITRVEIHISDENGEKTGGHDKRCMMEVRLKNRQPIAVVNEAETIDKAIDGAVDKLKRSIDHNLGRLSDHEGRKHANKNAMHFASR